MYTSYTAAFLMEWKAANVGYWRHFATEGTEGAEDTEWDNKTAMSLIAVNGIINCIIFNYRRQILKEPSDKAQGRILLMYESALDSKSAPSAESTAISHSHFHCRDFRVPFRVLRGKNPVPIRTFKARTVA